MNSNQTGLKFHFGWKSHFGVQSALYWCSHELRRSETQTGMDFITVILTKIALRVLLNKIITSKFLCIETVTKISEDILEKCVFQPCCYKKTDSYFSKIFQNNYNNFFEVSLRPIHFFRGLVPVRKMHGCY